MLHSHQLGLQPNAATQFKVASDHYEAAGVALQLGRWGDAAEHGHAALVIVVELANAEPEQARRWNDVGKCAMRLAAIERVQDDELKARTHGDQAITSLRRGLELAPEKAVYRTDLVEALNDEARWAISHDDQE